MPDVVADFVTLFRGRGDAYGSWDGGCIKHPLTPDIFARHLTTGPYIGVYPVVTSTDRNLCVWGCTDIDYDDIDHARLIRDAFLAAGVTAWIERTMRGWHVWVFATELVPAADMRRMFLAAHQVAEHVAPKEVNPKQEVLARGQVGNYVRLPYPGWLTSKDDALERRRYMYDDNNQPIPLEWFVETALEHRVTPDTVARLAAHYTPPVTNTLTVSAPSHDMAEAARRLTPLGRIIFRDGPLEGRDRSTTLSHLAHECFKAGLAPEDAMTLMEDADLRWGKFLQRGEVGRLELIKLVQWAYGGTASTSKADLR